MEREQNGWKNNSQDINKIFGNDKQTKQKLKKLEMKLKKRRNQL